MIYYTDAITKKKLLQILVEFIELSETCSGRKIKILKFSFYVNIFQIQFSFFLEQECNAVQRNNSILSELFSPQNHISQKFYKQEIATRR